jgi:hypothetical protein
MHTAQLNEKENKYIFLFFLSCAMSQTLQEYRIEKAICAMLRCVRYVALRRDRQAVPFPRRGLQGEIYARQNSKGKLHISALGPCSLLHCVFLVFSL